MTTPDPRDAFCLIVADFDAGLFCIEGPMSDDAPWHVAADRARQLEHAQSMAAHESPRTTKLYDRTQERLTQDEVERIRL
jgi:hypothetical protein